MIGTLAGVFSGLTVAALLAAEWRLRRAYLPPRFHYRSRLAEAILRDGDLAFTWGRHVFVVGAALPVASMLHELQHVLQFRRYGYLGFVVRYVWYAATVGYRANPLEAEARQAGQEE